MTFGAEDRQKNLDRMGAEAFDLCVIGGGIVGAGIARDAALRGLSVAIVERGDWGGGTSSRSSKLIHGGLRYLEQGRLCLVREGVRERGILLSTAPHLVRAMPFVFPVYEDSPVGLLALEAGMIIYDGLAAGGQIGCHRPLTRRGVTDREPMVRTAGLRGGVIYHDATTDDSRLVLATIRSAAAHGAVCANYVEVRSFPTHKGRIVGAVCRDLIGGRGIEVSARIYVNATGPWVDQVRALLPSKPPPMLRPSRGAHVVLAKSALPVSDAVVMTSPRDRRVVFAIPWGPVVLAGTTDTDHHAGPDGVVALVEDVRYILEALRHSFPTCHLDPGAVVSAWAGLRPLISPEGRVARPYEVSREERTSVDREGLVTIAGGKLTTYRLMAERAVDLIVGRLGVKTARRSSTRRTPLMTPDDLTAYQDRRRHILRLQTLGLPEDLAAGVFDTHLASYQPVAKSCMEDPSLKDRIATDLPTIWAQLQAFATEEMAMRLSDVMCRRTPLFFKAPDQGLSVAGRVADLLGGALGWDGPRRAAEVTDYRRLCERNRESVRGA